jgi:transcriptional regulator with XRE-family HTH domain
VCFANRMKTKNGLYLSEHNLREGERLKNEGIRQGLNQGKFAERIGLFLSEHNLREGERLKNERIRLGLNQAEFAEHLGIHKNTQTNYENGKRKPSNEYYAAAAELGVNVPYVITGNTALDFPKKAAELAYRVFNCYKNGFDSNAMSALFFIIGSSNLNEEVAEKDKASHSADIDALVKLAIDRGEEFYEAYSAITLYCHDALHSENDKLNVDLLSDLIFKTINLYDSVKDQFSLVAIHDNMRLVAQQVVNSNNESNKPSK